MLCCFCVVWNISICTVLARAIFNQYLSISWSISWLLFNCCYRVRFTVGRLARSPVPDQRRSTSWTFPPSIGPASTSRNIAIRWKRTWPTIGNKTKNAWNKWKTLCTLVWRRIGLSPVSSIGSLVSESLKNAEFISDDCAECWESCGIRSYM